MSEEVSKYTFSSIATTRNREILRNIAVGAWIIGIAPSIMAVVILNGTQLVFSSVVFINTSFLILNCWFCCATLHTLRKKRSFYMICLIFMVANVAVLFGTLIQDPKTFYQIIGFVGFALIFIACLALVVLNILLNIHGPNDPLENDREYEPENAGGLSSGDSPDEGFVNVRYVSIRRGRLEACANFQVEAGQILSLSQPPDVPNNDEQSTVQQSTPNNRNRLSFLFGERSQRQREAAVRHSPIRIISNGTFDSYRRDSSTSLLRRTSTESVEYDTSSVRCTCFFSPNETADVDEVPPYSEAPFGNISRCPIHGLNSISPPPYDEDISAYNVLCSVLGLPKYDDVVIKSSVLSSITNTETETQTTSPANASGPTRRTSMFTIAPITFDTIIEDGCETGNESFFEDNSTEYNIAGTSDDISTEYNIADTPSQLAGTSTVTQSFEHTTETFFTYEQDEVSR